MPNTTPVDLVAANGSQNVTGNDGADILRGGAGDDLLHGGDGADVLSGGQGADVLSGGKGDDIIRGGKGDDIINGGQGNDRAVYDGNLSDYTIYVDSQGRLHINDSVSGRDGNDTVKGIEEFNFNGHIYTYAELFGAPAI
jgi:RTX calcium-binding nonapeptide repeat (4 copies)